MIEERGTDFTGFRLISRLNLPDKIEVRIEPGNVFSIGRHSASVGTKQSDFEFGPKTKEVSRRHVVIERTHSGYQLVDIGSTAGTYVNGNSIIPNAPQPLNRGDRVSFGRAGADYEWENMG